jgi:SAM-dependent methyltransferase
VGVSTGWNHNIHYHPLVLAAAPNECVRALDIGSGDGVLTRELRSVARQVIGIDLDADSVARARTQACEGVDYVCDDFLRHPFEPASFDLVASVASLHHMDADTALARMADLLRPGGTLVVIGLARSHGLSDFAFDVAGAIATRVYTKILRKRYVEHAAPKVWPPPLRYSQMRDIAVRVLPGVAYRRHALWRYSLRWRRP